jgi:hypothetical protein
VIGEWADWVVRGRGVLVVCSFFVPILSAVYIYLFGVVCFDDVGVLEVWCALEFDVIVMMFFCLFFFTDL